MFYIITHGQYHVRKTYIKEKVANLEIGVKPDIYSTYLVLFKMCLTFIIFQSILKRWGYSWDRISWKGRLVVGLISLCMFVVPIKILHMKWMRMREERLFEEKLHQAEIDREQVI